jgi:hypothetical protein
VMADDAGGAACQPGLHRQRPYWAAQAVEGTCTASKCRRDTGGRHDDYRLIQETAGQRA